MFIEQINMKNGRPLFDNRVKILIGYGIMAGSAKG
jgi:hypothetical protein